MRVSATLIMMAAWLLVPVGAIGQQTCDTYNPCTTGVCMDDGSCASVPVADGTACDDGNPCTTGDMCLDGTCTGSAALPAGARCSYPFAGRCLSPGVCTSLGDSPLDIYCDVQALLCRPSGDPCQLSGCDPRTGACATIPVVCPDQCNQVGECDEDTGQCVYTSLNESPTPSPIDTDTPTENLPPTATPTPVPTSSLSTQIDAGDTCLPVTNTALFSPAGGYALIGTELISYTGLGASCSGTSASASGTRGNAGALVGVTRNLNGQGGAHGIGTPAIPTASPGACTGDCDSNGTVTVDELVKGVNITLGNVPSSVCPAVDCHEDAQVTIDCLVKAVSNSLNGCAL